ncbi:MAG: hypothetical protein M3418_01875, partial [Gemmatimonadota bacterium]|nr:hypothetical protein [Gemmatimonadota bacterium]
CRGGVQTRPVVPILLPGELTQEVGASLRNLYAKPGPVVFCSRRNRRGAATDGKLDGQRLGRHRVVECVTRVRAAIFCAWSQRLLHGAILRPGTHKHQPLCQ